MTEIVKAEPAPTRSNPSCSKCEGEGRVYHGATWDDLTGLAFYAYYPASKAPPGAYTVSCPDCKGAAS